VAVVSVDVVVASVDVDVEVEVLVVVVVVAPTAARADATPRAATTTHSTRSKTPRGIGTVWRTCGTARRILTCARWLFMTGKRPFTAAFSIGYPGYTLEVGAMPALDLAPSPHVLLNRREIANR
jgi:hypothetical protein